MLSDHLSFGYMLDTTTHWATKRTKITDRAICKYQTLCLGLQSGHGSLLRAEPRERARKLSGRPIVRQQINLEVALGCIGLDESPNRYY